MSWKKAIAMSMIRKYFLTFKRVLAVYINKLRIITLQYFLKVSGHLGPPKGNSY